MDTEIKIRLRGAGIKPDLISAKELAGVLESIDDFLVAETLKKDNSLRREDVVIGLCKIEDQSIGLTFKTTLASLVIPAFLNSVALIENNDFDGLSNQSFKALKNISNFSKKHKCEAEFSILNLGKLETLTKITPDTLIPDPLLIKGMSEIIGEVIRVGGKKTKAKLELIDGSTIYCEVQTNVAKDLGRCLYSLVKCSGLATWNTKDYELEDFRIMAFEKFANVPANETMRHLSEQIGHYFTDITDVPSFVASIRDGEI